MIVNPTSKSTDTRWMRWAKMLVKYEANGGTTTALYLHRNNTVRQIKVKLLKAFREL